MDDWSQAEWKEALDARGTPLESEAYRRLCEYLYPIALKLLHSDEDWAQEAVQQTLIRVHRYYPTFEWRSKIQTWACQILRRVIADIYGSRQGSEVELEKAEKYSDPDGLDRSLVDGGDDFDKDFKSCLDKLPENQRIAFLGIVLKRSTVDDLARYLGTTSGYVYRLSHEARKSMKKCMESAGWGIKRFLKLGNVIWKQQM